MAITSSLGLKNITTSVRSLGIAVTRVKKSSFISSKILMNRTKVKRSSLFEGRRLFQKKKESIRIKDQESLIEASKLVAPVRKGAAAIARSTQGFLGRILDFAATLLTGWLLYNLPTLISMAKELMGRITRMVDLLKGFVSNIGNVMKGFGNLLGAVFQNVISFDFFDTHKRVDKAMKGLTGTFDDMKSQIDEGIKLLTTSLGEGLVTGENAPDFGTRFPAQQPGTTYEGPGGPETTDGGNVLSKQAAYSYIRSKGIDHIHTMGIMANIQGESAFQIGVTEKGGTKSGVGLFQYTYPSRKRAFLQAVPDYKKNWKGQIDYAIGSDPNTALYLRKQFSSPEEAADDWMRNWENPDKSVYSQRRRIHNQFIKNFKPAGQEKPQVSSPTPISPLESQKSKLDLKKLGFSVGERAGYSPSRGRVHSGRDIAIDAGTPVSVISNATITDVGFEKGYGYFVAYVDSKGIEHFYGHLREMSKVRKGQQLSAGTIVGYVGSTGRSTGPHLHWEVSPRVGEVGRPRRNIIDPIEYGFSSSSPFGGTPAQISAQPQQQRRQQLPSQITPERQGAQIVLIDDVQPQQPQMPSGGGGGGIIPIIINPLNSYIKNKLLLDLAYT